MNPCHGHNSLSLARNRLRQWLISCAGINRINQIRLVIPDGAMIHEKCSANLILGLHPMGSELDSVLRWRSLRRASWKSLSYIQ